MAEADPARPLPQRKADSLHRLESDKDLWISSCNVSGVPYLVPLSFWWDGSKFLYISTVVTNPTAQNIVATGRVRIALGHTRDVTIIEALAEHVAKEGDDSARYADPFSLKCGWDPRKTKTSEFYRIEPRRIEAWRELNEHADRELMKDGEWLV